MAGCFILGVWTKICARFWADSGFLQVFFDGYWDVTGTPMGGAGASTLVLYKENRIAFSNLRLMLSSDMKSHPFRCAFLLTLLGAVCVRADVAFQVLYSFPVGFFTTNYPYVEAYPGTNGGNPSAALIQGMDGSFYGTTTEASFSQYGTVFQLTTNATLNTLASPGSVSAVVQRTYNGDLYGTVWDAADYYSVSPYAILAMTTNGASVPSFGSYGTFNFDGTNGAYPSGLIEGRDGNFYGTTYEGGLTYQYSSRYGIITFGFGTVYRITFNGELTSLYSFTDGNDGGYPFGSLVEGADGNFYGTTSEGGWNNAGTVFKITTNGVLTTLYSFSGGDDGYFPIAGLVQGSDGDFYGTTCFGGTYGTGVAGDGLGYGTVFRITTNGTLTTLASFNGTNGASPLAGLIQGSDGYFYGTTFAGGQGVGVSWPSFYGDTEADPFSGPVPSGAGTVFMMTTDGAITTLVDFQGTNGCGPSAALVQGNDGSFYGTTYWGGTNTPLGTNVVSGTNGFGTIFRLTVNPPGAPSFQTATASGGTVNFAWSSVAGQMYQVQCVSAICKTNWIALGNPIMATNSTTSTNDTISTSNVQRFYRVVLLR